MQLQKHSLYVNLKKCQFYKNEILCLGFVISTQNIKIEEKKIKAVKARLEL